MDIYFDNLFYEILYKTVLVSVYLSCDLVYETVIAECTTVCCRYGLYGVTTEIDLYIRFL